MNRTFVFLLFFLAESALAFGDTNIHASHDNVVIVGDNNSLINYSPRELEEMVKNAVNKSDNERYLKLAKDLGVTEAAIKNFFKILSVEQVPIEKLGSKLEEIAKHYKELQGKIETSEGSDSPEEVKNLIVQARSALDKGEIDQAQKLFDQASDLDLEAITKGEKTAKKQLENFQKRRMLAAEHKFLSGYSALVQLKYNKVAELFQKATSILPEGHEETLANYLNSAAMAFHQAGQYT